MEGPWPAVTSPEEEAVSMQYVADAKLSLPTHNPRGHPEGP